MRYRDLIEILKEKYEIDVLTNTNSPKIIDIHLLNNNNIDNWDKHVLYIGKFTHLKNIPDKPIMLLCVNDHPTLPKGSNCSHIHNEDMYNIFNLAKDLIFESLQAERLLFKLSLMALEGKNIVSLINIAASLLGNALILVDTNTKILAHSTIYEIADPLWVQNIENGYYSHEFIQKLHSSIELKVWNKKGSETQFITFPGDKQRKLVARITQENHLIGALIMIEHHTTIKRSHMLQLPQVGRILFDAFNKNPSSGEVHESFYSTLLNNILDEPDVSKTIEIIPILENHFTETMHVIVARFVHPVENRYLKHIVNMKLKQIFPDGYSVRYKGYMAILVSKISQEDKDNLIKLSQLENIVIGISWPFINIVEFKKYFNQAVASVKYAQYFTQKSCVVDYTDFSYYDLLHNYKGKISLKNFCHPALKVLREYDNNNNTEFYITLRTYLDYNKKLQATAEALFIHRNSLIYRLNRIKQLTGIDLDCVSVIYSLIDSFRIEHFLNVI